MDPQGSLPGSTRPFRARVPVVIVGGGPVGLSLALGLARHGVRSVLLEKNPTTSETSKAPGIHVRTREIFRLWGIEERFLEAGELVETLTIHSVVPGRRPLYEIDFTEVDDEADRPGLLILEQGETERLLLEAVEETGLCDVRFGAEVVGLTQDRPGATVRVRENGAVEEIEARFAVGCDGARSFVRSALGLRFEGATYSLTPMLADVRIGDDRDRQPWPRALNEPGAFTFAVRLRAGLWRIVSLDRDRQEDAGEVSDGEVAMKVDQVLGEGPAPVAWSSRFRIHVRSSPRFRVGNVLLAGDAAHVHSPAMGFGMNGGIQGAHNLAWKLAAALSGGDVDRLLDSYAVEWRAVMVGTVSPYTDRITRLFLDSPRLLRRLAFDFFRQMVRVRAIRMRILRRTAMLDLDLPSSPLLDGGEGAAGIRLPNPLLARGNGRDTRLYDLLPGGAAILVIGSPVPDGLGHPLRVIRIGPSGYRDPSSLLSGLVRGRDGWILVRPDARVAWAGHRRDGLERAVQRALGSDDAVPSRITETRDS